MFVPDFIIAQGRCKAELLPDVIHRIPNKKYSKHLGCIFQMGVCIPLRIYCVDGWAYLSAMYRARVWMKEVDASIHEE